MNCPYDLLGLFEFRATAIVATTKESLNLDKYFFIWIFSQYVLIYMIEKYITL